MIRIRPAAFAAVLLALAGSASAQSYEAFQSEWTRVTEKALFHLGPFQAFPTFQIRHLGFGDNVYFEDRPVRDFSATVAPGLTFYLPLRHRLILFVRESPEYTYYLKEPRYRAFTNGYGAGGKMLLFNRIVVSGEYQFQRRLQAVSVEIGRPAQDTQVTASASVFYETARRTSIGLNGSINKMAYEDVSWDGSPIVLSSVLNRTERGASLELYYRLRGEAFWFVTGGATEYRFDAAAGRDADSVQLATGLRFPILGRLSGTLSLGYKKLDPRSPLRNAFSGLVADSRIEARTGRFALRAEYVRDLRFSYYENAFYYIEDRTSAGASFYPAGFARLDYSFDQGNLKYPGVSAEEAAAGGLTTDSRTDRQWTHSVALVFRVLRTSGLGIRVSRDRWTSSVPGWNRDRTYTGIYLSSRF